MERAEAKKLGLTRYFTGRPCAHGHVCERYTSSLMCVECSRDVSNRHYYSCRRVENPRQWIKGNDPKNHASRQPEKRAEYERKRFQKLKSDPDRRIRKYLRGRFWTTLKGRSKTNSVMEYVGCTVAVLREHLQAQFVEGMSWENYGEWHVDHIRPCASFDMTDDAQVRACWHYTNLQPLWAGENCSKGAKWQEAA